MKVAVLPSWYPPNGGEFFRQQAHALARLGNDVVVLTSAPVTPKKPFLWFICLMKLLFSSVVTFKDKDITVIKLDYPHVPKSGLSLYLFSVAIERCYLYRLKTNGHVDSVHVHSLIWAGVAAKRLKDRHGLPYLVTEHRGRFVDNEYVSPEEKESITNPKLCSAAEGASTIVGVSSRMLPAIKRLVRSKSAVFDVLPNMVDTDFFKPNKKLINKSFRFFALAGLVPSKGFIDLINAFNLISEDYDSSLYIGGSGPEKEMLKRLVFDKGLEEKVFFLGELNREQVRNEMTKSDAFVLATRYEAFGVVFIEALSCGLPIATTKSGGPEEIIDEEVGYLSEVGDIITLAKNMTLLIKNRNHFSRYKLHEVAVDRYSENVVAKKLERLLKAIEIKNN